MINSVYILNICYSVYISNTNNQILKKSHCCLKGKDLLILSCECFRNKSSKPHVATFLLLASFLLPIPITFFILFYVRDLCMNIHTSCKNLGKNI